MIGGSLSPEELAAVKGYLRVDGDDEDALIQDLFLAAVEYLADAGVGRPVAESPRYGRYMLCAQALTLTYYDQRGAQVGHKLEENAALRRLINQLKLTEPPVSKSDTGG